jgi:hypothetical protein
MSVPTYGGISIFGNSAIITTSIQPRERQVNGFFGLDGVESLDGGSRGGDTHAQGVLVGTGAFGLAVAESLFYGLADGQARDLVDTIGRTWPNVLLDVYKPTGRVRMTPGGVLFRSYEARFVHLTS